MLDTSRSRYDKRHMFSVYCYDHRVISGGSAVERLPRRVSGLSRPRRGRRPFQVLGITEALKGISRGSNPTPSSVTSTRIFLSLAHDSTRTCQASERCRVFSRASPTSSTSSRSSTFETYVLLPERHPVRGSSAVNLSLRFWRIRVTLDLSLHTTPNAHPVFSNPLLSTTRVSGWY